MGALLWLGGKVDFGPVGRCKEGGVRGKGTRRCGQKELRGS